MPIDASPPNLRDEMCGGKRHKPASDEDDDTVAGNVAGSTNSEPALAFFTAGLQPPTLKPSELLAAAPAPSEPIPVYTGPTRTGAALIAAVTADADEQAARRHGKKSRVASKKPDAPAEPKNEAKSGSKDARPRTPSQARPNPPATGTRTPSRMLPQNPPRSRQPADKTDAKPAKPKSAAAAQSLPPNQRPRARPEIPAPRIRSPLLRRAHNRRQPVSQRPALFRDPCA